MNRYRPLQKPSVLPSHTMTVGPLLPVPTTICRMFCLLSGVLFFNSPGCTVTTVPTLGEAVSPEWTLGVHATICGILVDN